MPIATTTASPWPVRCAYLSAAIFTAASSGTNLIYGWQKGTDLPTSLVWSGVAGAVAIVFALSWPALIRSVDAKRYSAALIALVAMLLSGAYSVTAALGSASGGRANAAATETATTDTRTKAQNAYDTAKAELEALGVARPAAEIQVLIETTKAELAKLPAGRSAAEVEASFRAAQRDPQRYGCAMVNGSMALSCPRLDGELARARQRERLGAKIASLLEDAGRAEQRVQEQRAAARAAMDKASAELASIQPARVANSDAKALTRYLGALGLEVSPDRLNDLLVLLAVVMIEAGGGLSLAIGMALSGPTGRPQSAATGHTTTLASPPKSDPVITAPVAAVTPATPVQPAPIALVTMADSDIEAFLRASGGATEGFRRLAGKLGRPRSTVADDCHRLAAAGRLVLGRGRRGMTIALARPN